MLTGAQPAAQPPACYWHAHRRAASMTVCAWRPCTEPVSMTVCAWRLCTEPVSMTVCAWRLCTEPVSMTVCAWRLCTEPVSMTVCAWRLCTEPAWAPPRPCSHQTLPSAHCTLRLLWPHPDLAATTLLAVADKGLARQPPCLRLPFELLSLSLRALREQTRRVVQDLCGRRATTQGRVLERQQAALLPPVAQIYCVAACSAA